MLLLLLFVVLLLARVNDLLCSGLSFNSELKLVDPFILGGMDKLMNFLLFKPKEHFTGDEAFGKSFCKIDWLS